MKSLENLSFTYPWECVEIVFLLLGFVLRGGGLVITWTWLNVLASIPGTLLEIHIVSLLAGAFVQDVAGDDVGATEPWSQP